MERKIKYDYAFKLECVKLITEQDHSCESVSKINEIHESMIRIWLRFHTVYGQNGFLPRKNQSYSIDLN